MLRDETRTGTHDRPWTGARRLAVTGFLLGLTAAVVMLRGPARGSEDGRPAAKAAPTDVGRSFPPLYVRDDMVGVVTLRPAAALRHPGVDRLVTAWLMAEILGDYPAEIPRKLRVDTSAKGFLKLDRDDIEWASFGLGFGRSAPNKQGERLHSIQFAGLTVRTFAPFDWLAFLRQWRLELAEVRDGRHRYYRVTGPLMELVDLPPGDAYVYLPDDRTVVLDQEKVIRTLIGREAPPLPAFLSGPDWERASRGLLAVAIGNRDGTFAKCYDLGRPDDAVVLSLFRAVDHWTFSVDDADAIVLHAAAACASGDAGAAISRTVESLVKVGRNTLTHAAPKVQPGDVHEPGFRMIQALLANLRIEHTDRSVGVRTDRFGTLADLASIIQAEVEAEMKANGPVQAPKHSKP